MNEVAKRRWLRYSTRTLLVAVTMFCVAIAIFIAVVGRGRIESLIVRSASHFAWHFEIRPEPRYRGAMTLQIRTLSYNAGGTNPNITIGSRRIAKQEAETAVNGSTIETQVPFEIKFSLHPTPISNKRPVLAISLDGNTTQQVLLGDRQVGNFAPLAYEWQHGELHLINVYTSDGSNVFIHDVVLVQGDGN